jgi:hypothetical protein
MGLGGLRRCSIVSASILGSSWLRMARERRARLTFDFTERADAQRLAEPILS